MLRLFRNPNFRSHLVLQFTDKEVGVDVAVLLKNSSAKIAKWRYETTAVAFKALVNLIDFIENELQFVVVLLQGREGYNRN